MTKSSAHLIRCVIVMALGVTGSAELYAQGNADRERQRRVPVTVALVDTLPGGGTGAMVLRRATQIPRDIILLKRSEATGQQLYSAALHLLTIRAIQGDTATADFSFAVRGIGAAASPGARYAGATVARLRTLAPRLVPGVGVVPATEILLASKAMRAELERQGHLRIEKRDRPDKGVNER